MLDLNTILSRRRMIYSTGDGDDLVDGMRIDRLFGLQDLIKENLNSESVVCELGAHVGTSGSLFAYYCKLVYCVDVWTYIKQDYVPKFEADFDAYMVNFDNVIKIKSTSIEASFKFENHSLDLVYIDASHDYPDVKDDINCWTPKIKVGGVLAGHDYIPMYGDIDVKKAVDELLGKPDKIYEDSSWIKRL